MKITSPNKTIIAALVAGLGLISSGYSQLTTVYQDNFNRNGLLEGSAPDAVNTNGNVWQHTQGDFGKGINTYSTTAAVSGSLGSVSHAASGAIDGNSFLPVNGASGITLDGNSDFTFSISVANITAGGYTMGIDLADVAYSGGDQFTGNSSCVNLLAQLGVNTGGNLLSLNGTTNLGGVTVGTTVGSLELAYSASAGQLSYLFNGVTEKTISVTPSQIAAVNYIGIANSSFGSDAGTFTNLNLSVAQTVPEPATIWSAALGLFGLVGFQVRRNRRSAI